jgi:hypothetical protein
MDQSIKWFFEARAQAVIKALEHNRIQGSYIPDQDQVAEKVMAMIPPDSSVALGGSMTLFETGVVHALREAPVNLIDRFEKGISPEETGARLRQGLHADYFVSGVNAVTEQGELVFVDASCTRVAPILFGPKKVILVAGCNKIVPNLANAQERIRHFVAPTNAKRLGRKTPCAKTGQCADCDSPDRICNATVVLHKQADKERLQVVLVGGELGL